MFKIRLKNPFEDANHDYSGCKPEQINNHLLERVLEELKNIKKELRETKHHLEDLKEGPVFTKHWDITGPR